MGIRRARAQRPTCVTPRLGELPRRLAVAMVTNLVTSGIPKVVGVCKTCRASKRSQHDQQREQHRRSDSHDDLLLCELWVGLRAHALASVHNESPSKRVALPALG